MCLTQNLFLSPDSLINSSALLVSQNALWLAHVDQNAFQHCLNISHFSILPMALLATFCII